MTPVEQIASQLKIKTSQVTAVVNLLDEGNTVPFIARYRKEMTGSLDDEQIRIIADEIVRLRALDERRNAILASIEEQGKLTEQLRTGLQAAQTLSALYMRSPVHHAHGKPGFCESLLALYEKVMRRALSHQKLMICVFGMSHGQAVAGYQFNTKRF